MDKNYQKTTGKKPDEKAKDMTMPFGKYINMLVSEIVDLDPGYVIWLHGNTKLHGNLKDVVDAFLPAAQKAEAKKVFNKDR